MTWEDVERIVHGLAVVAPAVFLTSFVVGAFAWWIGRK